MRAPSPNVNIHYLIDGTRVLRDADGTFEIPASAVPGLRRSGWTTVD
jgi:hypothetical protein